MTVSLGLAVGPSPIGASSEKPPKGLRERVPKITAPSAPNAADPKHAAAAS